MWRLAVTLLLAGATPASAEWRYISEQSAFEGDFKAALTIDGEGHVFGLRCTNGRPELLFGTRDSTTLPEHAALVYNDSMPPSLLLRIDGGEIEKVPSKFNYVDSAMGVLAPAEDRLISRLVVAKDRVEVAIDMLNILHDTRFDTNGLADSVAALKENCKRE